ncbi:hypothetical protein SKAU_G00167060 [Synaphobranchus kaupii]|uniref:Uncharacterized protein n=1 Tax=Synaphobranchus kaupii TaxID=118154 RepID=A0A9Q1IZF5_SYNKA|nr:hypothetical protein SKAU_G00167060 [Synaphobranchus kaupii]
MLTASRCVKLRGDLLGAGSSDAGAITLRDAVTHGAVLPTQGRGDQGMQFPDASQGDLTFHSARSSEQHSHLLIVTVKRASCLSGSSPSTGRCLTPRGPCSISAHWLGRRDCSCNWTHGGPHLSFGDPLTARVPVHSRRTCFFLAPPGRG